MKKQAKDEAASVDPEEEVCEEAGEFDYLEIVGE